MGHCIHAIVAPHVTSDVISSCWPELPRLIRDNGFNIFPVDADLIDARIAPDETPNENGDEFMLLTPGFLKLLQSLSRDGQLAYVETEYFGGAGGQGALVFHNGVQIMPPTWDVFGTINNALKLIGVKHQETGDRFDAIGFGSVRDNDGLLELIAAQALAKRRDEN